MGKAIGPEPGLYAALSPSKNYVIPPTSPIPIIPKKEEHYKPVVKQSFCFDLQKNQDFYTTSTGKVRKISFLTIS